LRVEDYFVCYALKQGAAGNAVWLASDESWSRMRSAPCRTGEIQVGGANGAYTRPITRNHPTVVVYLPQVIGQMNRDLEQVRIRT
jgi:hypothetical protein